MIAVWNAVVEAATARDRTAAGTTAGNHGVHGRRLEGARRARDEQDGEDRLPAEPSLKTADRQNDCRNRLHRLAGTGDTTAVVAVGDLADHQRHRHNGNKLHQPDQAEIKRAAGQFIDLPTDRNRLHLIGDGCGGPRAPEQHKGPMAGELKGWRAQGIAREVGTFVVSVFLKWSNNCGKESREPRWVQRFAKAWMLPSLSGAATVRISPRLEHSSMSGRDSSVFWQIVSVTGPQDRATSKKRENPPFRPRSNLALTVARGTIAGAWRCDSHAVLITPNHICSAWNSRIKPARIGARLGACRCIGRRNVGALRRANGACATTVRLPARNFQRRSSDWPRRSQPDTERGTGTVKGHHLSAGRRRSGDPAKTAGRRRA